MSGYWSAAVIMVVLVTQSGCRRSAQYDVSDLVNSVFARFVYGGTEQESVQQVFSTGAPQLPLPREFRAGQAYVFYLPKEASEAGAWTQIEKQLVGAGAEIVRGPKKAGDLMHLTIGGPIFEFRFRYRGRSGSIRNELEPRIAASDTLSRSWALERYILQFDA